MKKSFKEAKLIVAEALRREVVRNMRDEIDRLTVEVKRSKKLKGDGLIAFHFPFRDGPDGGVYECKGGIMIYNAEDAAQQLADLTREIVSFRFNGIVHRRSPMRTSSEGDSQ